MRFTKYWSCISIVPILLTGCATQWVERQEIMEVQLAGATTLVAESHNGQITVTGEPQQSDRLTIRATLRAGARSKEAAQRALDAMKLRSTVAGQTCTVDYFWTEPRQTGWSASIAYDISAPVVLNTRLASHNGDVRLAAVQGSARLETHNGQCTAKDVQGDLQVKSHNGDIEVTSKGGNFTLETFNGRIIAAGAPSQVKLVSHNGRVELRANGGPLNGSMETYNGDIALTLAPSSSARLIVATNNGRIDSDVTLQNAQITRSSLSGTVGTPSADLHITTHNGDVVLK